MKCSNCSKEFPTLRKNQHLCSKKCRSTYHLREMKPEFKKLPTNTIGKINELRVAIDLFSKGFQVFENICSSGPCDHVFTKDNKTYWDLQVKTGYLKTSGILIYPKELKTGGIKTKIIAVVLPNSNIIYIPKLETLK